MCISKFVWARNLDDRVIVCDYYHYCEDMIREEEVLITCRIFLFIHRESNEDPRDPSEQDDVNKLR